MKDKILTILAIITVIGSITCFAIIAKVNLDIREQLRIETETETETETEKETEKEKVGNIMMITLNKDTERVIIYTKFSWGTVKGECSKQFFENVLNPPE